MFSLYRVQNISCLRDCTASCRCLNLEIIRSGNVHKLLNVVWGCELRETHFEGSTNHISIVFAMFRKIQFQSVWETVFFCFARREISWRTVHLGDQSRFTQLAQTDTGGFPTSSREEWQHPFDIVRDAQSRNTTSVVSKDITTVSPSLQ
jgi:hypothetical protein